MIKNNKKKSLSLFSIINYIFLILTGLICILPLVHMLAISLSSPGAANANEVGLWPVGFNFLAYKTAFRDFGFLKSFQISIERVILGTFINMLLTFLMAYPLSKDSKKFPYRSVYIWLLIVPMLFSGGLIPTYILVRNLHLISTIWALVLPSAVNCFFVILLVNFFKELPKELEESAFIDGASYFQSMYKIYIPLSIPIIATLGLFSMMGHWNSWFDGILYMNHTDKYPLQSYLQILLERSKAGTISFSEAQAAALNASKRSIYVAEMFLAMVPIIITYPFLQKYFTTGIILGSVKG